MKTIKKGGTTIGERVRLYSEASNPVADDYREIKNCINKQFAINSPEGVFVSAHLWTLPENWINGLAEFVRTFKDEKSNGWICANVLHDIGGYVNKDIGFSPRCFRGGSVWDKKSLSVS